MKKATLIRCYLEPADEMFFQGTRTALSKKISQGWNVKSGSNGSYRLTKPSEAIFIFKSYYGKKHIYNFREDILSKYNMQKLTQKAFNKFVKEFESSSINVYIDEYGNYEFR